MTGIEYYKNICDKTNWPKDDLCYPPSVPRESVHVLIDEFLGKDWYVVMPENDDQVITMAVCEILDKMNRMKDETKVIKIFFSISILLNFLLTFLIL